MRLPHPLRSFAPVVWNTRLVRAVVGLFVFMSRAVLKCIWISLAHRFDMALIDMAIRVFFVGERCLMAKPVS